jgi:cysteine desulfurase
MALYLDHNATSPLRPEAREAMLPWLGGRFGNAGSAHAAGRQARQALEGAREALAACIGASHDEVVLTSGGTESGCLAVLGAARASARGRHVLVGATEHACVLGAGQALPGFGYQVSLIPVDADGRVKLEALQAGAQAGTVLASAMHANNETGAVNDIAALGAWCRERGILFHTDAVQSFGKLPFNVSSLPVDLASFSAHKFGGPQGAGFLYVRRGLKLVPLLMGGDQEQGLRPGTQAVAQALGMAAAAQAACAQRGEEARRLGALRDALQQALLAGIPSLKLSAGLGPRVANTLHVRLPGIASDLMLMALDQAGVEASSGSACHAGASQPSHVLLAMGVPEAEAATALRFSLGWTTRDEDMAEAAPRIIACWHRLVAGTA